MYQLRYIAFFIPNPIRRGDDGGGMSLQSTVNQADEPGFIPTIGFGLLFEGGKGFFEGFDFGLGIGLFTAFSFNNGSRSTVNKSFI